MITVLQYLVIAAAIGLVVFLLAVLVFGRGEQMAPLPARTSPAELPDGAVAGQDIRGVRFAVAVRGYRMSDVDWTLERLADEVDRLRDQVTKLGGEPDVVPDRAVLGEQEDVGPDSAAGVAPDRNTDAAPQHTAGGLGHPQQHLGHPQQHAERDAVDLPSTDAREAEPDPMVRHRS